MFNLHNLVKKYAFERYVNSSVIAMIDILVSLIATICTIVCVDIFVSKIGITSPELVKIAICTVVATGIAVLTMRTHRIIIRHSTIGDIWRLAVATVIKEAVLVVAITLWLNWSVSIPPMLIMFDALLTFFCLILIRMAMVVVYDTIKSSFVTSDTDLRRNLFIYGSSEKSTALNVRLANSPHYKVVGFIQYEASSATIAGLNLYHFKDKSVEQLEKLFANRGVKHIIFPNYDTLRTESERFIPFCTSHNIKILVAPPIDEAVDGNIPQSAIREVKIEDLLGREEIKISMKEIISNFTGKTVLVTGAAGSIGSELCRQLATFGVEKLVMFDNAETPMHNIRLELEDKHKGLTIVPIVGDVRQPNRLEYVFSKHHPQVVFHAAAYKHVPLMEENPCEAVQVNVHGSRNVADMCVKYDAEMMVMISTDKAVNPTNIMGCTKRLAEIYVQSLGAAITEGAIKGKTKFVTTRFGNVLGSNGSVIPRFREQIIAGGPVTVTHPDITRFFMTIPEACRLVMEAATMSSGNQIFVFDMGESVKIVRLAERMIELAGFKVGRDIEIKFTGLRPGEKLYEEVLSNAENTIETAHAKIRIAKVREYNYSDATTAVDALHQMATAIDIINMVKMMKQIVPEFKSQNSQFEELDK
ncbi:MAG: polysaccharide biosynthesis protein [Alistipes sp.]|nr:polysaccharide biosynthesis protein [Alistipes sp.]